MGAEEDSGEIAPNDGADEGEELVGTAEMALTNVNYSTYLGGSSDDSAGGVAVDGSGNVYIVGYMRSLSPGATDSDIFVRKLSPTGALVYHVTIGTPGAEGGSCARRTSVTPVRLATVPTAEGAA